MSTAEPSSSATVRVATWPRFVLVEALQVLPAALALVGTAAALWTAALIGSALCCYGTDSGWRWRNRLLIAQAIVWLLVPALA